MSKHGASARVAHAPHQLAMEGEGRFITHAARQGWYIYRQIDGHAPCDFIVETPDEGLLRVEVRTIGSVQGRTQHSTRGWYCNTKYNLKNFDYMYVSTPEGEYWIPRDACPQQTLSITVGNTGKYEEYRV